MISITINNFKDEESMAIYELPEGSSVLDLKTEIEATEDIPIGYQRLVYWKEEELQDNDDLDFLIRSLPFQPEPTIDLLQARIYIHRIYINGGQDSAESLETLDSQEPICVDVDLDKPILLSLRYYVVFSADAVRSSGLKLFFLNSAQVPISILDFNQTLSYYGIRNGNAIRIVYDFSEKIVSDPPPKVIHRKARRGPLSKRRLDTIVQAKHNWDGKIMHPSIRGLPLKRNALFKVNPTTSQSGWLYGSPHNPPESTTSPMSEKVEGYFPRTFVFPHKENTEEDLETADASEMLDIPPLPPFQFPPADRMSFYMPISDRGHSFLKMKAKYEFISSPVDPTHITITLLCSTHDIRRISSVSLFIETPKTTVSEVEVCEHEAHREEIHIEKEVTESRSRQTHFDGVNIGTPSGATVGFQGGMSRGHSIGSTERGSRVSRRKVDAGVYNDNTVFWNLKAPTTRLDEDGLIGEESITFILTKKPVEFKYKCRVTHSRDGVEKTMQRVSKSSIFDSPLPSWLGIGSGAGARS